MMMMTWIGLGEQLDKQHGETLCRCKMIEQSWPEMDGTVVVEFPGLLNQDRAASVSC